MRTSHGWNGALSASQAAGTCERQHGFEPSPRAHLPPEPPSQDTVPLRPEDKTPATEAYDSSKHRVLPALAFCLLSFVLLSSVPSPFLDRGSSLWAVLSRGSGLRGCSASWATSISRISGRPTTRRAGKQENRKSSHRLRPESDRSRRGRRTTSPRDPSNYYPHFGRRRAEFCQPIAQSTQGFRESSRAKLIG
jgi:hypothetical protein